VTEQLPEDDPQRHDRRVGERAYYFACDFPDPTSLTASMTGPSGAQPLELLDHMPNPDLKFGQAQRLVVWSAICDLPPGPYTLTIADGQNNQAQHSFALNATNKEQILTVPEVSEAGKRFEIYYCGYQPDQEIQVDFYFEVARDPNGGYFFWHSASWDVQIGPQGWTTEALWSLPGDPARSYLLLDHELIQKGSDQIWIVE
jgi:hypothetical protein